MASPFRDKVRFAGDTSSKAHVRLPRFCHFPDRPTYALPFLDGGECMSEAVCVLTIWLMFGLAAGAIGARKGEGFLAFIMGLLLGPFGILIALISGGDRTACPYCSEQIRKKARVCPHCRTPLTKSMRP